ncbi:Transcription initiation factor TFIID subunit 12 [Marasmius sp. AFHP31]|nr:Transcription initiation factor TFIID subunit 12 [Marasmius sp. AFHP31]
MDKPAASSSTAQSQATGNGGNMIEVLHNLLRTQTGEQMSNHRVAHLLLSNMETLVKQGKLNPAQIQQLKQFAEQHRQAAGPSSSTSPTPAGTPTKPAATPAATTPAPATGLKTGGESALATLGTTPTSETPYSISTSLSTTNPGPVPWPAARPTLSGGAPSGRVLGTPTQIARTEDSAMLALDDNRSRRKSTPGDQSMRRSIQELVASIDPNVKIEPEVEDLLLSIADEFIDSVTNFSCRLARHRGSDILEVKDLQLHLERNHNIRIPGFASDDTRLSLSQSTVAPVAQAASGKKNAQGPHMTLRSQRLQQVQHAKREAKLM